jgi:hypothetical protein
MSYAQAKRIADALEALVEEMRLFRKMITDHLPSGPATTKTGFNHDVDYDELSSVSTFPPENSSARGGL